MKHSISVKRRKRGTALTEFAIMVPIMFLLTMGAADFSRMFYTALSVAHSADVSSQYGSQTLGNSVDYLKMRTLGGLDAFETQGTTVTAVHFCVCVAGGAETSCALDTCGGQPPRVYVKTTVRNTFTAIGVYPGISGKTVEIARAAYKRVQ